MRAELGGVEPGLGGAALEDQVDGLRGERALFEMAPSGRCRETPRLRKCRRALTPQAVNLILKRRAAQAGLDPVQFSAHGLRSGYLTETARRGIPLPEAMQQSQHRSVQQAASYYNEAERTLGQAARLIV